MTLSNAEFEALISDQGKRIVEDIQWDKDEDHSPCVSFRAEVLSDAGWPMFVNGNFNPLIPRISFHLIHRQFGRIYGLDHGQDHRNPDGNLIGDMHKHRWTETHRDKQAYVPPDITAPPNDPVTVWEEFCLEASMRAHLRPLRIINRTCFYDFSARPTRPSKSG